MRGIFDACLLVMLASSPGWADDLGNAPEPALPQIESAIKFPELPRPETVAPAPIPVIASDTLYVVASDQEFFLKAAPSKLVEISHHRGPMLVSAKFADGNGDYETRKYEQQYIATLRPVKGASGQLTVFPFLIGTTDPSKVPEILINIGAGPRPPPTPVDPTPVDPTPVDPTPKPAAGFAAVIVYTPMNALSLDQHNAIYSIEVADYLDSKTSKDAQGRPEWRIWAPDQELTENTTGTLRALWTGAQGHLIVDASGKVPPQLLVVRDGKGDAYPIPASKEEMLTLLKKIGG